jgi:hypothetical protein
MKVYDYSSAVSYSQGLQADLGERLKRSYHGDRSGVIRDLYLPKT